VDQPHAIHGFGWQGQWTVVNHAPHDALLRHDFPGGDWPWPYRAEQHFMVENAGFTCRMMLRNDGTTPMPAGLGLHPYFPRAGARLALAVDGYWEKDAADMPAAWRSLSAAPDWFGGDAIDHVFTGAGAGASISWPGRRLTMTADAALAFTVVYVPVGEDYFCVEPVSHMTDAVNRRESPEVTGLRWLAPGARWDTFVRFALADA
jgi:aldose 1-epimerase